MKPKYNPFLTRLTLAASSLLFFGHVVQAAPINWGAGTTISADSDVLNAGASSYAYALSNTTQAVNGVTFTGSNSTTALGANVTLAGWNANTNNAYNSGSNPFNALSGNYKAILIGGTYTNAGTAATVTLNNLTSGRVYATQIWVGDPRAGATTTRTETVTSAGGNTVTLDYNTTDAGGGLGQYSIGRFTADSTTQLFTLTGNASTQLNAIQLREVTNIGNWVGSGGDTWDAATTNNFASNLFSDALNTTTFDVAKAPLDSVTFADTYWNSGVTTAITQTAVTVAAGGVSTGRVFFDNSAINYTVASADATGITGGTALVKNGSGTVTFTGANTFTGATTISGGVLQLGDGGTAGNLSGTASITNNANLTINRSNAFTQATDLNGKAITGTGSFTQAGSGTTTLSIANSYSGGTSINNGSLAITTGSALGSGLLTLNGGTLVGGAFTVANNIAVNNVAYNRIYTNAANLTLTGTWSGDGALAFSGSTTASSIIISGDTTGYSGTINFDGQNSRNNVFVSGSGANLQNAAWNFTNTAVGNNFGFGWNGVGSGTVKVGALSGSFGNIYNNVGSTTMTLEVGNLNTSTTFGGVITNGNGTTALTKVGSGTLILTGANTYTGTTTISGGTLQIGNGGTTGSLVNGAIVNNGALVYSYDSNSTASLTSGGITGTGSVSATAKNITLNGNVTSAGNQTYNATATSGLYQGITLNAATVNLTATGGASISLTGDVGKAVSPGHTLNIDTSSGNGTVNLNIAVGRSGIFYNLAALNVNAGNGAINWTGTRAGTGNQSTPIALTGAINFTSNFVCQTAQTLTLNTTGASTVSGNLTGPLSLVKAGASSLTLSGTNSFTGGISINGGSVIINSDGKLGGTSGTIALDGGAIKGSAAITLGASRIITLGTGGGYFSNGSNQSWTVNSKLTGSGFIGYNYDSSTSHSITLSSTTNDYTGETRIGTNGPEYYNNNVAAANLKLGATDALPFGAGKGNVIVGFQVNGTAKAILDLNGFSANINGLNTNNAANSSVNNSNAAAATLTLGNGDASGSFGGVIQNTGGALSLVKTGAGTQTLSGANTYTGATTVNSGTLIVNGNISTSATTVKSGATLGGSGTVGALTVESGGFVTPGNSPGILNTGNYDQAGTLTLELNGTTAGVAGYDQVSVTGTVNLSGALTATVGYTPVNGDLLFILLNNSTDLVTGTFSGLGQGATVSFSGFDWQISYTANGDSLGSPSFTGGNDIALMAIPEPSAAALIGTFGLLALLRRRRA